MQIRSPEQKVACRTLDLHRELSIKGEVMSIASGKKPEWLKISIPKGPRYKSVRATLSSGCLHTVCEEARCPNMGECWEQGTATFMLLGKTCTRGCRFCAVNRGDPMGAVDAAEPERVAQAAARMKLDYAVLTSVTRDDLDDGGAELFARTVEALRRLEPAPLVELLIPDYRDAALEKVIDSGPAVLAHNIEVVPRLTASLRHPRFTYEGSLKTLEQSKQIKPDMLTKSSIMLGLGESLEEVVAAMDDLRGVGVDILVLGQYLQPTRAHAEVVDYVTPRRFEELESIGQAKGFGFVASGPLVRTSYKAAEAFASHHVRNA